MLPRSHRLRRTGEIRRVLKTGRCLTAPYIRICICPSSGTYSRIACVVGKSVHQSAVKRHRYQRWLRELAGQFLMEQPAGSAYDMVWIARPSMVQAHSLTQVKADVQPYFQTLRASLT